MELDYYVQICARNSRGHRQESEFIDWLTSEIDEMMQYEEFDMKLFHVVKKSDWRDILLESNSGKLDSMLDRLEDILRDSITSVGECIATVDYDQEATVSMNYVVCTGLRVVILLRGPRRLSMNCLLI